MTRDRVHRRGDVWRVRLLRRSASEQPIDVSGRTYRCQWRPEPKSAEILATAAVDMGDADQGVVWFTVPVAAQTDIEAGSKVWFDIEEDDGDPDGPVTVVQPTRFEIEWDVTR